MHGLQACLCFKYITVAAFHIYAQHVKMPLKGEVALYSHGNYIVDNGKSGKNNGFVLLNFCGNPVLWLKYFELHFYIYLADV